MSTAFVLAGGGSLGAVQVGMLQALGEHGVQPDLLIGASAGAVNALWVAEHGMSSDSLAKLTEIWVGLDRSDIFPLRPLQVLRAVLGRDTALTSSAPLGDLVETYTTIKDLTEAPTPVHMLTADLLSGLAVLVSSGSPGDAVRASAAIPGIFPPMHVDGRWLVDGALAAPGGVAQAVEFGATEVYVLPTGVACDLPHPPRSALGVAIHALTILIEQGLMTEVTYPPAGVTVRLIPPLCPVNTSPADFSHAAELIRRARKASIAWIEDGGLEIAEPARFLSLHHHS